MQIKVRLFALLRELFGASEASLEVPEGCTAQQALELLFPDPARRQRIPKLMFAINQGFVKGDAVLHAGDELVFVPPVSGG